MRSQISTFTIWAHRVIEIWALMSGFVLIAIVIVTSVNVMAFGLDRFAGLFGHDVPGIYGYEDFVRLAISCAALMFLPYCQLKRGHVAVDFFAAYLSRAVTIILDKLGLLLLFALSLFLAYWMSIGLMETWQDKSLSPVLGWPEWPFYLPGILSLILWSLVVFLQLFERRDIRHNPTA